MRNEIEKHLSIKAINIYGLSEIISPATGEPVGEGEQGELVITTLIKEGMPLLRYRTRDLTRFLPGECACGSWIESWDGRMICSLSDG